MFVAWDNGQWVPIEAEWVQSARELGYEVREVHSWRCLAPKWLDEQYEPERIKMQVDHGMAQLERYLAL